MNKVLLLNPSIPVPREIKGGSIFLYSDELEVWNDLYEVLCECHLARLLFEEAVEDLAKNGSAALQSYVAEMAEAPLPAQHLLGGIELFDQRIDLHFKTFIVCVRSAIDKVAPIYALRTKSGHRQYNKLGKDLEEHIQREVKNGRGLPTAQELVELIASSRADWIEDLAALRDQYVHYSSLDEFEGFWLSPYFLASRRLSGIQDFARPTIKIKGRKSDAVQYQRSIEEKLFDFVERFVEGCSFDPNRKPPPNRRCRARGCSHAFAWLVKEEDGTEVFAHDEFITCEVRDTERRYAVLCCPRCYEGTDTNMDFWEDVVKWPLDKQPGARRG
jgi:hypothetical protein